MNSAITSKLHKGVSQAMWIVIALIVAFVIALIVLTIFNSTSSKAGTGATNTMTSSQTGVDATTCQALCNNCKLMYGSDCLDGTKKWDSMKTATCQTCT